MWHCKRGQAGFLPDQGVPTKGRTEREKGLEQSAGSKESGSFRGLELEWKTLSRVWLFSNPWTIACQDPLSMEFSRQEFWSGLPFPSPGDLPNLGTEPGSSALQADSSPSEPPGKPFCGPVAKFYSLKTENSCWKGGIRWLVRALLGEYLGRYFYLMWGQGTGW